MLPDFQFLSLTYTFLVLAISGLIYQYILSRKDSLSNLPYHKFDKDDTPQNYVKNSAELLHSGYVKYTKKGIPFRVRNAQDPNKPQIIMPFKYLDEVKNAPQNRLSFPLFSRIAYLLDYSNAPQQTDAAAHVVRSDLNKYLPALVGAMQEECEFALHRRLPECKDWTSVHPYMTIAQTISQITTRVLCGLELARNDEWIKMSVETTMTSMATGAEIRDKYPVFLRWLAPYRSAGSKLQFANRKRAAEIIAPILEKRRAGKGDGTGNPDGIQWLLRSAGKRTKTAMELADEQLFLSIASIHTTTATVVSFIHDLADHRQYYDEILEEIQQMQKENGRTWTKQSLSKLEKLDSFMKESQRVHPIGLVTVTRAAVKPFTFKDGLHLPTNTLISFPMAELNRDADIWTDSDNFDGYRFLRMRKEGNPNSWQFAFVGENSINFGAGAHACPGRYFVSQEVKILLAYLLLEYQFKWPEGKSRPGDMNHDLVTPPNAMAELLFKKKAVKV